MHAIKSFFQAVFKSCFDFSFYKSIKNQNFWRSLGYLSMLMLIAAIVISTAANYYLHSIVVEAQGLFDKDFPNITIKKGIVSIDANQPFIYENTEIHFILDPKIEAAPLQNTENKTLLLVGKNFIAFREKNEIETNVYDLSKIDDLHITKETAKKITNIFYWIIAPIILIVIFLGFLLFRLLQILLFSLIGLIFNKILKANLTYQNIINICTFSITGPILISMLMDFAGLAGRIPYLLYFHLIYAVYIFLAIKNCKE